MIIIYNILCLKNHNSYHCNCKMLGLKSIFNASLNINEGNIFIYKFIASEVSVSERAEQALPD